jgi:hypothetical protein
LYRIYDAKLKQDHMGTARRTGLQPSHSLADLLIGFYSLKHTLCARRPGKNYITNRFRFLKARVKSAWSATPSNLNWRHAKSVKSNAALNSLGLSLPSAQNRPRPSSSKATFSTRRSTSQSYPHRSRNLLNQTSSKPDWLLARNNIHQKSLAEPTKTEILSS